MLDTAGIFEAPAERQIEEPRPPLTVWRVLIYAALAALAIFYVVPFVWLISTSLKTPETIFDNRLIPAALRWQNYADVIQQTDFLRWTLNSAIVTLLAIVSITLSSALVAYPFAKLRFPLKRTLFALILGTMMLPSSVTMVPTFLIWRQLGTINTFWPLWAGNLFGSAFYIFMLRQFLMTIPDDLRDAAMVDGASQLRTFWDVMLPLIQPALIAVALFEFVAKWNDYLTPLIYLNRPALYTLSLGLATFVESEGLDSRWDLWMAGSVLAMLPVLIVFLLGQRFFVEGIATTGIKG